MIFYSGVAPLLAWPGFNQKSSTEFINESRSTSVSASARTSPRTSARTSETRSEVIKKISRKLRRIILVLKHRDGEISSSNRVLLLDLSFVSFLYFLCRCPELVWLDCSLQWLLCHAPIIRQKSLIHFYLLKFVL